MATRRTLDKIIAATMKLAEEHDWSRVTLERVASESGLDLSQLRAAYDSRMAILEDFNRQIDLAVLGKIDTDMIDEEPRERVLDILLARFDALAPYKSALRSIARAARRDPAMGFALNTMTTRSMTWMMSAAGIDKTGAPGAIRAMGLTLVWYRAMRVWFSDDDPGMTRTMAALDKRLREGERSVRRLDSLAGLAGRICGRASRSGRRRRARNEGEGADYAAG